MAHEVPPLPYDYAALEPYIDTQTMHLHHDKHHQAYVTNLNAAVEKAPELGELSRRRSGQEAGKRARGGPHRRAQQRRRPREPHHVLDASWARTRAASPAAPLRPPSRERSATSPASRRSSTTAGLEQFGSGWAWLVRRRDGKLQVMATPNQDNPLFAGLLSGDGQRRVGARLLPEVPEPPRRLPKGVVERGELGGSQQSLPDRKVASASNECKKRVRRERTLCDCSSGCRVTRCTFASARPWQLRSSLFASIQQDSGLGRAGVAAARISAR